MSMMFSAVAELPENMNIQACPCFSLLFASHMQKWAVTLKMLPQRGLSGALQAEVLHKFITTYIIDLYYLLNSLR